jgi:hypothetical protein
MPYGNAPDDPREYNGTVFVNGIQRYSGFTVDSEIGMVRFDTALTINDVVQMAYSWKVRVRVDQCNLQPTQRLARNLYGGSILLMQSSPAYLSDPYPITMPWEKTINNPSLDDRLGISIDPSASGGSGSSHNSHITLLWKDTRYTL